MRTSIRFCPGVPEPHFYRTAAGAEIDLVIDLPGPEVWAVEIKYGTAPKFAKHFSRTCKTASIAELITSPHGEAEKALNQKFDQKSVDSGKSCC